MAINKIDELLNVLEHLLTKGMKIPLSGGRALVYVGEAVEILEEIRESLPSEVRIAGDIAEREEAILENARKSAQMMIQKAEEKACLLVNEEEILQKAMKKAQEVVAEATINAKEIKADTYEHLDDLLNRTENGLLGCLNDIKNTKNILKQNGEKQSDIKLAKS
jgi:cell division septum initiation protein DivIVA